MSGGLETSLMKAQSALKRGALVEAEQHYRALSEKFPRNNRVLKGIEQLQAAVSAAATPQAEIDRLIGLYQRGAFAQAIAQSEALAALHPQSAMLFNILGAASLGSGDFAKAEQACARAAALDPGNAEIHNSHGIALSSQGKLEPAIACFDRALAIHPAYAEAHYNRGNALGRQQALDAAIAAYGRALAIRPDYADAYNNLGLALQEQDKSAEAMAAYGKALAIKPNAPETLQNLANLLFDQRNLPDAIKAYKLALGLQPDRPAARGKLLFAQAHICDFSVFDTYAALPAEALAGGKVSPFSMLPFADDPALQLRFSQSWAQNALGAIAPVGAFPAPEAGARIRIGYFSADFHDHATMRLMAGLFREHDRQRFEVIAYSYGPPRDDAIRAQLVADVDRFVDIGAMSNGEAIALVREHRLDIAVDLKGYTQHARPQIFAQRAAPLQISYVGYPGSMGGDFIDYIIADDVVIPPEERRHYKERVIALPGSYQPNDNLRPIADSALTRTDHGLPETGFVFCCFNQCYKIGPREFDIWMRLLAASDGGVLWLLNSNPWAEAALRDEAQARGIDSERLIFAAALPQAEHLARLRHADLFLDTFNVNAHTTASDALWAGLPVLTKAGRQFAARVGASLVKAVGLPELVVEAEAEYEARALTLAADPALLAGLRSRLAANRLTQPLFDTEGYTRQLEAAFQAVHERRLAGLAPDHLSL